MSLPKYRTAILVTIFILVGFQGIAQAGDISTGIFSKWSPSGCYKPMPPSYFVTDAASYNMAIDEYNRYIQEMKDYLSCLENEAQQDLAEAQRVVQRELDSLQREAVNEAGDAKADLLNQKYLIR